MGQCGSFTSYQVKLQVFCDVGAEWRVGKREDGRRSGLGAMAWDPNKDK